VDAYFNKAGSREEKRRRMQAWMTTKRLIVATNALGLGINVPDVRLVIHVGLPYQVRAFAQESGRLGRDGKPGTSIIICKAIQGQSGYIPQGHRVQEEEMVEYIRGIRCRRFILDKTMDGRIREGGCQDNEATCDVCIAGGVVPEHSIMTIRHSTQPQETAQIGPDEIQEASRTDHTRVSSQRETKRRRLEETNVPKAIALSRTPSTDNEGWTFHSQDPRTPPIQGTEKVEGKVEERVEDQDSHGTDMAIYRQEREQEFAIWKKSEKVRDDTLLTEGFEAQLADWSDSCIYCRVMEFEYEHDGVCPLQRDHSSIYHAMEGCVEEVRSWMCRPGSFARFCGCWECGLPYRICQRWEDIHGDGGKFRRVSGGRCQYPNIMAMVIGAGFVGAKEMIIYIFQHVGGVPERRDMAIDALLRIGGRRRKNWGGMETNEMCVGMSMLMDWFHQAI